MKTRIFLLVLIAAIAAGCKLKTIVTVNDYYPPTSGRMPIYQTNQKLPENIVRIGSIVVGEGGLTPASKCTYEACMQVIEDQAKKKGADLVYIVKVTDPDFWKTTCYNITAELYKYEK